MSLLLTCAFLRMWDEKGAHAKEWLLSSSLIWSARRAAEAPPYIRPGRSPRWIAFVSTRHDAQLLTHLRDRLFPHLL